MSVLEPEQVFKFEKTYLKDVSFESPGTPEIFANPGTQEVSVECSINHRPLHEPFYEVVLTVNVNARKGDDTNFAVEVQQGGIFQIAGGSDENLPRVLEIVCPDILMAFARVAVCDLVTRGGFPQLLIDPVNFEALYEEKQTLLAQQSKG